ncbi:hypothetical protein DTO271G3_6704 [Paecilomyces variotii]|nr:hypothetical protein DTO271G3_6704 [Paecilomyces variotii]
MPHGSRRFPQFHIPIRDTPGNQQQHSSLAILRFEENCERLSNPFETPFSLSFCGGYCAADNWRGVRIPGSSSVGQRLAQAAFLASRERPSRGAPPTTRRVAVSVGVLS